MKLYHEWLEYLPPDSPLRLELEALSGDESQISDRFYRHLAFGTGGLRGEMGAGTNRMNVYTVGRATQGLADFLREKNANPVVCVACDTRNMSKEFAEHTACVLCSNGIKTYLFDDARPAPMLSFAVREMRADAGVVITASHNPKQYNGYKVYGNDGGQITDAVADAILSKINSCNMFTEVKTVSLESAHEQGLLCMAGEELDSAYFALVKKLVMRNELLEKRAKSLRILYSPLHGSGNKPVRRVLAELGFSQVSVVSEQENADGNFPTVNCPNPEDPGVFDYAIEQASRENPDLIFATDPDCDRIGVLVRNNAGEYSVLTGNQTGALLCDYILKTKTEQKELPINPVVAKTIVTTELAAAICKKYNAAIVNTLTGFKYIGEKIGEWEHNHEHTFLFGLEESYGYLAGDFVRDKDAVIAAVLISEMALYYKEKGITLYDAMQDIYKQYGYYLEKQISVSMPGQDGQQRIAVIISDLRKNYFPDESDALSFGNKNTPDAQSNEHIECGLKLLEDYETSTRLIYPGLRREKINLPPSNALKFIFDDESWIVLRPSGTEPKIKLYIGVRGEDCEASEKRMVEIEGVVRDWLGR